MGKSYCTKGLYMSTVKRFRGEYSWLSNMHQCAIPLNGEVWPSVENYYQSRKTNIPSEQKIFLSCTPSQAKAYWKGKQPRDPTFYAKRIKYMEEAVYAKFSQNMYLKAKLLQTGSMELVEGNWWGDTFWGVCDTKGGLNNLGIILMNVREKLREEL